MFSACHFDLDAGYSTPVEYLTDFCYLCSIDCAYNFQFLGLLVLQYAFICLLLLDFGWFYCNFFLHFDWLVKTWAKCIFNLLVISRLLISLIFFIAIDQINAFLILFNILFPYFRPIQQFLPKPFPLFLLPFKLEFFSILISDGFRFRLQMISANIIPDSVIVDNLLLIFRFGNFSVPLLEPKSQIISYICQIGERLPSIILMRMVLPFDQIVRFVLDYCLI